MSRFILAAVAAVLMAGAPALAAEIKVFSAGAVEPGLVRAIEAFKRASGEAVKVEFNTAPQLASRLAAGEVADVLIAPPAALDQQVKDGKVSADARVTVGRVGAGMVVRAGLPSPDIATTAAFKQTMLGADSIVYNTASSGLYLDKLFERLGIADAIKAKTTRYPNGERVMEHLIHGKGNEIGFGAITEIKLFEPKGLKLVGPLPAEVQNYTSYAAALMTGAPAPQAAKAFLAFLGSAEAKQAFAAAGIE
ncbi:MAG TPA: substrate-binding domain-containing protein [Xanthobacteraceae bacterium]|nr:substrate-binding domain-containing protein [Xanthobacteraceae bacterium]